MALRFVRCLYSRRQGVGAILKIAIPGKALVKTVAVPRQMYGSIHLLRQPDSANVADIEVPPYLFTGVPKPSTNPISLFLYKPTLLNHENSSLHLEYNKAYTCLHDQRPT